MADCPRCGEKVDRESTFCANCGTDLRARGARPGDVILVLDRGLVQFAKFALAILGIFLVFGAFVFGFDLKKLTGEMHERRAEMAAASDQIDSATEATGKSVAELDSKVAAATKRIGEATAEMEKRLREAEDQVAELKEKVAEAERALARIHRARTEAEVAVSNLLALSSEELARAEAVSGAATGAGTASGSATVEPTSGRPNREKLFVPGSEITYAFLGEAAPAELQAVRDAFNAWAPYVNLTFREVDDPSSAIIRIAFEQGAGSWSYVGTDALDVASTKPTMNFGWPISRATGRSAGDFGRDTALREIGHAIGFVQEHQNPHDGIVWNEQAVYDRFSGPPNNWSREQIEANILRKLPPDRYPCSRPFDPNSIMMFAFEAGLTASGKAITPAGGLSDSDKACAREMYPPT